MGGRISRRYRKARRQPAGMRLAYLTEPFQHRFPLPFVAAAALRLGMSATALAGGYRQARDSWVTDYIRARLDRASGYLDLVPAAFLYALVLETRPDRVVETGTANGASTAFILAALAANGHGELVSIDLPFGTRNGEPEPLVDNTSISEYDWSPVTAGEQPGWLVPEHLRDRWTLRLGDARDLLPAAVADGVDVFFHDSLHTREHMLFEFETAWPMIADDGLLICDDVFQRQHDALPAFAAAIGSTYATFSGVGAIRKTPR